MLKIRSKSKQKRSLVKERNQIQCQGSSTKLGRPSMWEVTRKRRSTRGRAMVSTKESTMVSTKGSIMGMKESTSQSIMVKSTRTVLWTRSKTRSMVRVRGERRRRRARRSMNMDMSMAMTAAAVTVIRSSTAGVWDHGSEGYVLTLFSLCNDLCL